MFVVLESKKTEKPCAGIWACHIGIGGIGLAANLGLAANMFSVKTWKWLLGVSIDLVGFRTVCRREEDAWQVGYITKNIKFWVHPNMWYPKFWWFIIDHPIFPYVPQRKKIPTHAFWGYKSSVFRHIIEIQVKLPSGKQPHSYGKIHHAINGKIHELNHHFQ